MLNSVLKPLQGAALGLVAVAALVASAPAHAVAVNVTYNMTYSFFSPAANAVVQSGTGSMTLTFFGGTYGGHVGAGGFHVAGGTAMLNNTVSLLGGQVMLTGMQLNVFGSGGGSVTPGGLFNLVTVGHIATGMLHCSGAFCGLAGFPVSVPIPLTSGPRTIVLLNQALLGFPSVGPQNFNALGTAGMTPQGGNLVATVTGQEVGRAVVPEPGTGMLLGCGLALFGIVTTALRTRRGRA